MSHLLLTAHMDDEFVFFAPLLCTQNAVNFCVAATETSAPRHMEWETFQASIKAALIRGVQALLLLYEKIMTVLYE
jgi:hypothetical protein